MATPILMPKLGLTMTEGIVESWDKKEGDSVQEGDTVCTISSEKLTSDVQAPISGTLIKIVVSESEEAAVKAPIGYIGTADEHVSEETKSESKPEELAAPPVTTKSQPTATTNDEQRIFITPLARKMAAEKNLDYHQITGTGGNGRITRKDIENYQQSAVAPDASSVPESTTKVAAGLTGMRQVIAQHMRTSLQNTAQLTLQRKVNLTKLMAFRKQIKDHADTNLSDGQLSLTTLLARATILALEETPQMNGRYENGEYTQITDIHLGLAVGLDEGLIVPVVKNAQNLNLTKLAQAFQDLTSRARTNKLKYDEYQGGTFTITNLGHEHVEYFTPIINTPEIGILGVGALQAQLVLNEDKQVSEAPFLPLSLTFDHQIIDGQQAAIFLDKIVQNLQTPYQLIF